MNVMQATSHDPWWSKRHSMRIAAPSRDRRSVRGRLARLGPWCAAVLLSAGGAGGAGCTASSDEVHPDRNVLFYPSGLALSPDNKVLFVANANGELRFDSGAISVINVGRVQDAVIDWLTDRQYDGAAKCQTDPDHSESLVCDEEFFMDVDAGVRIGNFATDLAIQKFPSGAVRVFAPTRGDPSVAWADYADGALHCGPSETFGLCDDAHRLAQLQNNPDLDPIPDEPYGVFADGPNGFVAVTHLSLGGISLIASADPGTRDNPSMAGPVRIVDVRAGFFTPDQVTGLAGTTGIAGRRPGASPSVDGVGDVLYVGSQTDRRIQTFTVGTLPIDPAQDPRPIEASYIVPSNYFLLTDVGNQSGLSLDTRGMQFSADGNQLFMVQRSPPSLQVYDTSLGSTGFPKNVGAGGIDICREASTLAVVDSTLGQRVYVTCFQDGQIYVIDPRHLDSPDDILLVGRGPYSVVASDPVATDPAPNQHPHRFLFVSNFLEDTIAVVDIQPGSPTFDRVVLRIGTPRAP